MLRVALLDRVQKKFPQKPLRIGFPEDEDPRVQKAASELIKQGLGAGFCLFSEKASFLNELSKEKGGLFQEREVYKARGLVSDLEEETLAALVKRREHRGKSYDLAVLKRKSLSPLYQGAFLLQEEHLDCLVAGCSYTTKDVILAGLELLDQEEGVKTLSSSFLLDLPEQSARSSFRAFFSDCGVVIDPSVDELVSIAEMTVETWKSCRFLFPGEEPVVAFLSFATHSSANHAHVSKVRKACALFQDKHPELMSDGPLQFDAAFDRLVRKKKTKDSPLGNKRPNIYIFPDLNSGNIAYKIAQRLGGGSAYGPLLQGFKRPYTDLSRGADVDAILASTYLKLLSLPSR